MAREIGMKAIVKYFGYILICLNTEDLPLEITIWINIERSFARLEF